MKALTKVWLDFSQSTSTHDNFVVTNRLITKRLNAPDGRSPALYIAINALSGAIDILNEEEGKCLEELQKSSRSEVIANLPANFIEQLKHRGYLFSNRDIEDLYYRILIKKYKNKLIDSSMIIPFFAIDSSCGVGCDYCFEKPPSESAKTFQKKFENSVMDKESLDAAFKALDLFQSLLGKTAPWIGGYGGEPLKESHAAINEYFIKLASERNLKVGYFTSLTMLGDKLYGILRKNKSAVAFVQATLDGDQDFHESIRCLPNSFTKTVDAIDKLLSVGVPVTVRTNINANNVNEIPKLAQIYEEKRWFDNPLFKSIVTRIIDRYHQYDVLTEEDALSSWLRIREQYPLTRKMKNFKISPTLIKLLQAVRHREVVDGLIDNVDFEVSTLPSITYCSADVGMEYVFTGKPECSIYTCGSCYGRREFKIGDYFPELRINKDKALKWTNSPYYIGGTRSIDEVDSCHDCKMATMCGGNCPLESIIYNGSSNNIHCKNVERTIRNFLEKEEARLYSRCWELLHG